MHSAAHFRSEAAKCRTLAKIARDKMTAMNLLALAADYEAQASQLEREAPPNPMPSAE